MGILTEAADVALKKDVVTVRGLPDEPRGLNNLGNSVAAISE